VFAVVADRSPAVSLRTQRIRAATSPASQITIRPMGGKWVGLLKEIVPRAERVTADDVIE
jgi:hypothetical protein